MIRQNTKIVEQENINPLLIQDYSTTITILEHLSDAIFILSNSGNIEYANQSAYDMLGLDQDNLINKNIEELIPVSEQNSSILSRVYTGVSVEVETEIKAINYNIPVLINFSLVKDSKNQIRFIIASARDIAWRKEMERVLNQKQILEMSKNRFREMGELTINIVHNLSQPLTSLRLKLELLQKEFKNKKMNPEKIKAHLGKMDQLLDVIDSTVNNARTFATQTEDETFKIIKIKESINNALNQLRYEFTENDIDVITELGNGDPMVMANPLTLQQVFVTLMRMQMKYLASENPTNRKRKIILSMANNQSKWLGIMVTAKCEQDKDYIPQVKEIQIEETFDFDLKVVKLITESLGGDFNWYPQAENGFIFSIRIPVDTDDERAQLRNMIELFHDA